MVLYFEKKKKVIFLILPYQVLLWQSNGSAIKKHTIAIEMITYNAEVRGHHCSFTDLRSLFQVPLCFSYKVQCSSEGDCCYR